MKNEVNKTSKFNLKLRGSRVLVKVPKLHRQNELKFLIDKNITSLLVPLNEATMASFRRNEKFVKDKFSHETYESLWTNNVMYVNVSNCCKYQRISVGGSLTPLP